MSGKVRFAVAALLLAAAAWLAPARPGPQATPFRFGIYVAGGDSGGLRYWMDPLGIDRPRDYARRAFREIRELGFDFVSLNSTDPADLPWILEEAEAQGLRYVWQGRFPSYYDHQDGYEEFPPEHTPGSRFLAERLKRRERMRREMIPFLQGWVPKFRQRESLLSWTMTEEIPRDPMIYADLAELATVIRKGDSHHPTNVIFHWIEALEEAVPVVRPGLVRIDPYVITPEFQGGSSGGGWWVYEDFVNRAYRSSAAVGAPLWVIGQAWYNEVRVPSSGGWRVDTHRMPSEGELRAQLWLAIAGGAKAFEVFAYNGLDDAGAREASRRRGRAPYPYGAEDFTHRMVGLYDIEGHPTPMVSSLRKILAEVKPLADLLGKLDRQEDSPWPYSREESPIRVRAFRHHENGAPYWVVVNADPDAGHPLDLNLGDGTGYIKARLVPREEWKSARQFSLSLPPGGGAIIQLSRS